MDRPSTIVELDKRFRCHKRVTYRWEHVFNLARTWKVKHGVYYGTVKHTVRYTGPQLAVVHFDGNRVSSRVPIRKLVEE